MTGNSSKRKAEHILSLRVYLLVGVALMILTAVTVAVSFIPLGGWNAVVAVAIASVKASLVALFFMHLLHDKRLNLIIFLIAILFLTIFITLTMFDTLTRGTVDERTRSPIQEEAVIYQKTLPDSLKNNLIEDDSSIFKDTLRP